MKIKCPACSDILEVPDSAAGTVVSCPCGKQLRVPNVSAPASAPASASPPGQLSNSTLGAVRGGAAVDRGGFEQTDRQNIPTAQSESNRPKSNPPESNPSESNPYSRQLPGTERYDPLQGYAPPSGPGYAAGVNSLRYGVRASLGQRILGALVDSFLSLVLGMLFAMAGGMLGAIIDSQDPDLMFGLGYLGFYVGLFATWILNAVLITMSGQSVGKKVAKTRIVDRENGTQSGFLQGVLLRNFVFGLITLIPCIGSIVGLVDLIMLFPEPNETLHDKLARTVVVQA